ncbi:MAG: hypothetical protein M0027_06320 [Candidatus Dormibacteraeota bacterium]|nr:hypothetical protein [Candidatus Dormibacteraeota bacterium]
MDTDLRSLAISPSRRVAACLAPRAARSSPRSRTVVFATSSTTTRIRGQLAGASDAPASSPRRTAERRRSSSAQTRITVFAAAVTVRTTG